ncbi:hypothetical protein NN3_01050 [Nocardia neocaledoniensis NBRC 108232]|uniref:DUF218 domain-containing protein n=1 Tax=Nocardia neocaledoniensis TaxID=236511 RepID=A0A317NG84_9NOCA|nr:YdcF family protein [Nocardia neocaledoniensis]PWV74406.1 DUF218 domain-containing protein [Nocardia neocaledoniensis]GEM29098.1 hypothetical protein NN3_01050 [Nocardia neocaledoniensis NBRC 108232]
MIETRVAAAWLAEVLADRRAESDDELPVPYSVEEFRAAAETSIGAAAHDRDWNVPLRVGFDHDPDPVMTAALDRLKGATRDASGRVMCPLELQKTWVWIELGRVRGANHGQPRQEVPIRALVVLGGGMHPDGQVPPWVDARADAAAQQWATGRYAMLITSGRGPHPQVRSEADALAEALIERGVPAEVIARETASTSTAANAWFVATSHLDPIAASEVTVVTNGFHAVRTQLLFEHIAARGCRVAVHTASDEAIPPAVLRLLRICDDAQTDYLGTTLLPRIARNDRAAWRSFLFDPASPLTQTWRTYRDGHDIYRTAWKDLSARMAAGRAAVSS